VIPMFFRDYFSDLGGFLGFSFFALALFGLGGYVLWKQKKRFWALFTLMFILFSLSLYNIRTNIFLNFFVVAVGGLGFYGLIKSPWKIRLIKDLSIMLIICGLLFSFLSFTKSSAVLAPNQDMVDAYSFAKDLPDGIVLSHYTRGTWIEYYANKKVFLDSRFACSEGINSRYNASGEIFFSRNLMKTSELLNSSGIRYVIIDDKMKDGLVWEDEDEGIQFLFRNNETFKNIYDDNNVEIWEYLLGKR
jgi:hypothetical protein